MVAELTTLIKPIALAHGCSGPYNNVVPKLASYPCIAYFEIGQQAQRTKDADTYAITRMEIAVFAKEGNRATQKGPADICYDAFEQLKRDLNGFLGLSEADIIEIRWDSAEMDYNEETEVHVRRGDFIIQHT